MTFASFAIVPAAGLSRRMGQDKLSLPWDHSRTVLGATLDGWAASGVGQILVVLRADQSELRDRHAEVPRIHFVVTAAPPPEMKDSVRAALAYCRQKLAPDAGAAWLLAPADMPRLPSRVVDTLLAAHDPQAPAILKPSIQGRHGHPVLFPWQLADVVDRLPAHEGVNALSRNREVREIPCCDPAIFDDIDTREDYRRLQPPR